MNRVKRGGSYTARAFALVALFAAAGAAVAAEVEGRLAWVQRVELSTPVSGVVSAVPAVVGAQVKKGAILLTLDARGFRAEVSREEARERRSKAALDEARRERDRSQELYNRTLLSEHDLQLAKIALTAAESAHQSAKAALTQARLNLEYSAIRAPFDALVLDCDATVGQTVVTRLQSTPLVVVAASGRMAARAAVPSGQLAGLKEGQAVTVRVGERSYPGHISRIALEPLPGGDAPLYRVEVRFPTGGETLRAGGKAILVLP